MISSRLVFAGSIAALAITSSYVYLRHLHGSLRAQVTNVEVSNRKRREAHTLQELECLPEDLLENPDNFRIIHESDEKDVRIAMPTGEVERQKLFTYLLRHNMSLFSRFPQCWILRLLVSPDKAHTFSKQYIESLDFKEGDVCCGFQMVLKRDTLKAEMGLIPHPKFGDMNGRLVLSLRQANDGIFLRTDTIQWVKADSTAPLLLESNFAKYLHDFASWGLLVAGANYLEKLYPV